MKFMNPNWLLVLAIVPIVIYLYMRLTKKKKSLAIKFSSLGIIKKASGRKRKFDVRKILFFVNLLIFISLIIALADPYIPLKRTKEGVNVILAIDVSGSMMATDYQPNRVEAAKKASETLIKNLKPKDYVGIVIFSDGATTASYLTPFKDRALEKLSMVTSKEGRTAIGDGLSLSIDMATSVPNKKKLIILLSDGVNNAGVISPDEAIEFAKPNKIQVFTIGMGSEQPVLLGHDFFGNPQYAELDEATLKKIASETKGEYYKSVDDKTLNEIYSKLSEKIERKKEQSPIKDWFIFLGIILILIEFYLRYGRYRILP